MAEVRQDQSLTSLVGNLMDETTTLIRKEISLVKAEMGEKASQAGAGVAYLAVGGAIAFAGFLVLLDALVLALVELFNMSPTIAALIVGVIVAIIGFVVLQKGRSNLKATNLAPERTMNSLNKDAQMAQDQVQEQVR